MVDMFNKWSLLCFVLKDNLFFFKEWNNVCMFFVYLIFKVNFGDIFIIFKYIFYC